MSKLTEKFIRKHLKYASKNLVSHILSYGLDESSFLEVLKNYTKDRPWEEAYNLVFHPKRVKRTEVKKSSWFNSDSKSLTLAACRKIKPGSFIRVRWYDSDDAVMLTTDKMHADQKWLTAINEHMDSRTINYDQIVEVLPVSFMMPKL